MELYEIILMFGYFYYNELDNQKKLLYEIEAFNKGT